METDLTTEDIAATARPQALSPLHQELIYWNNRMYHMHNNLLIKLAKERVIPHRLVVLKQKSPICASCHFGQAHKRPWQTKGKHTNPIRSKDYINPGDCVSIDPIVSAQTRLVLQMSGYFNSDRTLGIALFVDHETD